jgi:exodeoxyribonuclease V beta subunit
MKRFDAPNAALDGLTLIEASAGTGKTTTITTLVLRLLVESRLAIEHILVVTFTRAATAELRDRVRRRVAEALRAFGGAEVDDEVVSALVRRQADGGDVALAEARARLARALRDFDRAAIHTIHGFCQRSLLESAFESRVRFDVELVDDVTPLRAEVVHDYWARVAYGAPAIVVRALRGKAGPAELASLAALAVRHPRMPVLPDAIAPVTIDEAPAVAAMTDAARIWRAERDRIVTLLCADGLNKGKYAPETVREKWAPALDALWAEMEHELPKWFWRLTPAGLDDGKNKGHTPPSHPFFVACEVVKAAHDRLAAALAAEVLRTGRGLVDYARAELARRKRATRTQSFDDLLLSLDDALRGSGGEDLARRIARGTKAILVDEFQDTDPVQYAIFRRLHELGAIPLFLIGDPKQAIYGFRGADVFSYMHVANEGAPRYTLDTNYRSDPSLVGAVNDLFTRRAKRPFVFRDIEFQPVKSSPKLRDRLAGGDGPTPALTFLVAPCNEELAAGKAHINKGDGEERLPRVVAGEIARLLSTDLRVVDEPVAPRHVAVLCRTNDQARAVQAALRDLRVPSVLDGDSSVFESPIAEELVRVLGAIARPSDIRRVRAALATSLLGADGAALYRMQLSDEEIAPWLERFARWGATWHEQGFVQAAHLAFDEAGVQARLLSRSDGERRLTDLLHLTELLHASASQRRLGPLSLLRWYQEMHADPEARKALAGEAAQIRLEHDEHAVRLTTIHRSKGLEYPIVFCPFLWTNPYPDKHVLFHDHSDEDRLKLDLGSSDREKHGAAARKEAVAEAVRLAYVALTRARHRCYVVWGRFAKSNESALARLLHPVDESAPDEARARESLLASLGPEGVREALEGLAAESDGRIGVRDLDFASVSPITPRETIAPAETVRGSKRDIVRTLRTSSFTALVRTSESRGAQEEGADRDEHAPGPDAVGAGADGVGVTRAIAGTTPVPLAEFPGGTRSGLLLHSIFEHLDFRVAESDATETEVRRSLARYGFDVDRWSAPVADTIRRTLATPLDPSRFALGDVARTDRVDEMEFLLPAGAVDGSLVAKRLAAVLTRHGAVPACPGYVERVAALGFAPLRGYLKGFVDLVFRHAGRFYVVDYKSNLLGPSEDDYRPTRLAAAMAEHHYPLQYLLYVVAFDRYLSLRVPDYDYDTHFGGVRYLFVRGMSPDHAPGTGVFSDRPSADLVAELRTMFTTPPGGATDRREVHP